jgi:hypothetical protein
MYLILPSEFQVLTSSKKMLTQLNELTDYLTYGREFSTVGKAVNRNSRFLLVTKFHFDINKNKP